MNRQVITLNAGSSSIKFALFELDGCLPTARAVGLVEMLGKVRRITVRDGAGAPIYEDAGRMRPARRSISSRCGVCWSGGLPPSQTPTLSPPGTASCMAAFVTTGRRS